MPNLGAYRASLEAVSRIAAGLHWRDPAPLRRAPHDALYAIRAVALGI